MDTTSQRIREYLRAKGKVPIEEIAQAMGIDQVTANRHLRYLQFIGEVVKVPDKDRDLYRLWGRIGKEELPLISLAALAEYKDLDDIDLRLIDTENYLCPYCRNEVLYTDKSCPKCGLRFLEEEVQKQGVEEISARSEKKEDIELISFETSAMKPLETRSEKRTPHVLIEKPVLLKKSTKREKLGVINGVTNGITNGLINGLKTLRYGMTNGITNGNGIINGLDTRQVALVRRRGLLKIFAIFIFIMLMITSPFLLNVVIIPEKGIEIDGDFSDWNNVKIISDTNEAASFNSNIDIIEYGMDSRLMELSFFIKVEGDIFQGEPEISGRGMDTAYIFIDTDQFIHSGFEISGIGADYMVKVEGWKGNIYSQYLYEFTSDIKHWDLWNNVGGVSSAASGSELEIQVGFATLGLKQGDAVDILFLTQSFDMQEDFSDTIICSEKGVLIVEQQGLGKGYITGDSNSLLRLDLAAQDEDIVIKEIILTRIGVGSDSDIDTVRLMDGSLLIAETTLNGGFARLQVAMTLTRGRNKILHVEVDVGSGSQPGNSVGLKIAQMHDVITNKGTITLRTSNPSQDNYEISYIKSIPQGIVIDGAFADWDTIFKGSNPNEIFSFQGADCQRQVDTDSEELKNENVNLAQSKIVMNNESASFYLSVKGRIMAGAVIPQAPGDFPIRYKPSADPSPPGLEPPDMIEPLPPPLKPRPLESELAGEDTAHIFLDTDDNSSTGYKVSITTDVSFSIGADWLIKITGRSNSVRNSGYFIFNGFKSSQWDWKFVDTVTSANDADQLETQIEFERIGFQGDSGLGVAIYIHDWNKGSEDHSNDKLQARGGRSYDSQDNFGSYEDTLKPQLRLKAGVFDPLTELPDVDSELITNIPSGYYIVQFTGPIKEFWKNEIQELGGKFYGYIPKYAFIVGIDRSKLLELTNLSYVRWLGIYQPAYKAQEGLLSQDTDDVIVDVLVFENREEVASQIEELGGNIDSYSSSKLRVSINQSKIKDILYMPHVEWVEKTPEYRLSNNVSDDFERLNVVTVWKTPYNLNGTGQIVAVCDTGLDTGVNDSTMHDDFEGRIVKIYDLVGGGGETAGDLNSGHGTHVAGSVLGNGTMSSGQIKGMAYGASLVFQAAEDDQTGLLSGIPVDLNDLFWPAYNDSARIHTNSWGSDVNGQYTTDSQNVDEFVWANRDMTILFSAGNEGTDSNSDGIVDLDSINAPATAKNCITVGASENYRSSGGYQMSYGTAWPSDFPADPLNSDLMSNNSNGMVAFSSRGATDDGRIKPDVVAPGTNVLSTRSSLATGTLWGVYNAYYVYSGGTSMSTPLVAGTAALARQYYVDKKGHTTPSGALLKATLINGAVDLLGQYNETASISNFDEGWGRVNLTNSIYPSSPRSMKYEDVSSGFTQSDQVHSYEYVVATGEALKITLVWTDYPGTPTSGGLVNDLNLNVTAPNGTSYYYGNNIENGWSNESHVFDDTNNVESVYIQSPSEGIYTIKVMADNIASLGSQPDQDYALVISGNFQFRDDVGVETLIVNKTQLKDTQAEITATIKNFGRNNQSSPFDVRCVI
ncbi:MAG: S8 family serine peptidase, partial [Thermoplasmata archaeon]